MEDIMEKLDEIFCESLATKGIAKFISTFITVEPPYSKESDEYREYIMQIPYIIQELCLSIDKKQKIISDASEKMMYSLIKKQNY